MSTEHAIAGCLIGTAIGDALGLPCEGISPRRARRLFPDVDHFHFLFGRGMFSDDTEHACMTAQSLIVSGGDSRRFVCSLAWRLRWWLVGLPPSVGKATLKSCVKLWLGVSPQRSGVWSAGNGPCMRAPILGVMLGTHESMLRDFVRQSTRLTHTDPRAEQAALVIALATAISMEPREGPLNHNAVIERIQNSLSSAATELREAIQRAAVSLNNNESTEAFAATMNKGRGVSGYVLHTVPAVLHAWLRFPDDYASAVQSMVRCGGDTDSTAALVGGIVGARVGVEGIPERWRKGLAEWPRNIRWLQRLSRELARGLEKPRKSVRVNPIGIITRNMVFTGTVFAHLFRRLFPPY
jgi:ADP-ribosyl-[dinitrogen reductase] hydrolase